MHVNIIDSIKAALEERGAKISTAESCTSGYISGLLTSIPGSSNYFEGSAVVYSINAKKNVLGVDSELIKEYTEVSAEVACDMANKVKELMGTQYSIASTGYADVAGYGTEKNPPGTIYVAISTPEGTFCEKLRYHDTRGRNIYLASMEGLDMILSHIKTH